MKQNWFIKLLAYKNKTAAEGTHLKAPISLHNFSTDLPYSISCTDLIFTDQPNLVVNSRILF